MPRNDCRWTDVSDLTGEDVFDSRDVESAIDHLESILPDAEDEEGDAPEDAPRGYTVAPDPDSEGLYLWRGPGKTGPDSSFASREEAWADARKVAEDDGYGDERALLSALLTMREDYSGSEGFAYGATFIRESHFRDYAEQLADDIGAIDRNASWPVNCIDWERAADELKADYSTLEVDGTTFYYRA